MKPASFYRYGASRVALSLFHLLAAVVVFSPGHSLCQGLFQESDLLSVTFYEMTSGPDNLYIPQSSFGLVLAKRASLGSSSYDHEGGTGAEYYDLYTSDSLGNYNLHGNFLTIDVRMDFYDIGGNIDAVRLEWGGTEPGFDYATKITRVVHGGPPALAQTTWTDRALGAPDGSATGLGATRQGTGIQYVELMSITLAFPDSFYTQTQPLSAPVTPDAPLTLGSGGPGSGALLSFNPATPGDLSFTQSSVHPSAFGFSDVPPPPPDAGLWSGDGLRSMFEIEFDGTFTDPAQLVFNYDDAWLPPGFDEQNLVIHHYTGTDWETLNTTVDAVNNTLTFQTASFSPFVVGIPEPNIAGLIVIGLGALVIRRARRGKPC